MNGAAGRGGSAAASLLPAANGASGARGAAAAGNGTLTTAQAAAQMALCNGAGQMNGLVPVRTGLAWATLGVHPFLCQYCCSVAWEVSGDIVSTT